VLRRFVRKWFLMVREKRGLLAFSEARASKSKKQRC
jgi:hypothetical protein